MSGPRPNPLRQVGVDRGIRLAAGLAAVVAIPVAVLFYFQFRSLSDLEDTSAVVLRQLGSDTADSLTKVIDDTLKRPHIGVLLGIPQTRMEPPDPAFIAPILSESLTESPFIDEFYIWSRWQDMTAFDRHAELPHTVGFVETMESLLDHPFKVTLAEKLW